MVEEAAVGVLRVGGAVDGGPGILGAREGFFVGRDDGDAGCEGFGVDVDGGGGGGVVDQDDFRGFPLAAADISVSVEVFENFVRGEVRKRGTMQ